MYVLTVGPFVDAFFSANDGGHMGAMVGYANGMVGYVPHKEAFARGGYETTFGYRSKLAPEAGDLLADAAITLVRAKK